MTDEEQYRFQALTYALDKLTPNQKNALSKVIAGSWKTAKTLKINHTVMASLAKRYPGLVKTRLGYYKEPVPSKPLWFYGRYRTEYRLTPFGKELKKHMKDVASAGAKGVA